MRILYAIPGLGTGGSERLVLDCARALRRRGCSVVVAAVQDGPLREEFARAGVTAHVLGTDLREAGKTRRLLGVRESIRRLASGVDVVHSHHFTMLLGVALASIPGRRWTWVHTEHTRPDIELSYTKWLRRIGLVLLYLPDALTGVSPEVVEWFARKVPRVRGRCHLILNGIDLERFSGVKVRAEKRRELGYASDAWIVGTVGNLRPQKNHALLLRGFRLLSLNSPEARLVVVGDGDAREGLEGLSRELGIASAVRFLGSRLDVPEILAMLDVYCLTSHYEGMPLSVLEAMASGVPVVVTDVEGNRSIVTEGVTGLMVGVGDQVGLSRRLELLRRDSSTGEQLSLQARHYVTECHGLDTMIDRYAALYQGRNLTD